MVMPLHTKPFDRILVSMYDINVLALILVVNYADLFFVHMKFNMMYLE